MIGRDARLVGPDGFTRLVNDDAALIRLARAEGWEEAAQTAVDCGLLGDVFASELRGRNPYRLGDSNEADADLACEWCDRTGGSHDNGCRLGLGPDEQVVRLAQEEALRTAARTFVTEMGDMWGGDSSWMTTGNRVAEVVACVLREMADDSCAPPTGCAHQWIDRPESDTRACDLCGEER